MFHCDFVTVDFFYDLISVNDLMLFFYMQHRSHTSAHTSSCDTSSKKFQYTLDTFDVISPQQRRFFEENGFLVIKNLVSPESVQEYRHRFKQICNKEVIIEICSRCLF